MVRYIWINGVRQYYICKGCGKEFLKHLERPHQEYCGRCLNKLLESSDKLKLNELLKKEFG